MNDEAKEYLKNLKLQYSQKIEAINILLEEKTCNIPLFDIIRDNFSQAFEDFSVLHEAIDLIITKVDELLHKKKEICIDSDLNELLKSNIVNLITMDKKIDDIKDSLEKKINFEILKNINKKKKEPKISKQDKLIKKPGKKNTNTQKPDIEFYDSAKVIEDEIG